MKTAKTALAAAAIASALAAQGQDFATRIARWSGDAKGAYSLYYDDGTQSALALAAPTLVKYGLTGTFYVCFGWFEKKPEEARAWIDFARAHPDSIRLANHTWSHCGVTNYAHAVEEIGRNADFIRSGLGLPASTRISFAKPGGVPWRITNAELDGVLKETRGSWRPDWDQTFTEKRVGGRTHIRLSDAVRDMDEAEKSGSFEKLLMHGVGGDWFRFPAGEHLLIVRELARRQAEGRLWVGASMDVQDYEKERDRASVKGVRADKNSFTVDLECGTDPEVYSYPLTLVSDVPDTVDSVTVSQGTRVARYPVSGGKAVYEVLPVTGRVKVDLVHEERK